MPTLPRQAFPSGSLLIWRIVLLGVLILPMRCYSAEVLFIRSVARSSVAQQELEEATDFYGLDLNVITSAGTSNLDATLARAVAQSKTLAVVIAADALTYVSQSVFLHALSRRADRSVPLLILGLTTKTDPNLLKLWSGGAVVGCERLQSPLQVHYAVGLVTGVTGPLTGLEMPVRSTETYYFVQAQRSKGLEIIDVRNDRQALPVFIETTLKQEKVFLDCTPPGDDP